MRKVLLPLFAAAAFLAGCATVDSGAPAEPREERVYSTGSNIPKRQSSSPDGVQAYDREALQRARDAMPQAVRPGLGGTP